MKNTKLTIEKTFQGAIRISCLHNGYLVTMQYFDYSRKEAISMFKEELKTRK